MAIEIVGRLAWWRAGVSFAAEHPTIHIWWESEDNNSNRIGQDSRG